MANPVSFPTLTQNFQFPLLFSGQAQKEFFVNQALSKIDALLQGSVQQSTLSPPSNASEGSCFRILAGAIGEWAGHDENIALWIGGSWAYVAPIDGMTVFDQQSGQNLLYDGGWKTAAEPSTPAGGDVIDIEARAAISEIAQALRDAGVLPR